MKMFGYLSRFLHIRNGEIYTMRHHTRLVADVARGLTTKQCWCIQTTASANATAILAETVLSLENTWHTHTTLVASRPLAIVTDGFVSFTYDTQANSWKVLSKAYLPRSDTTSIEEEEARAVAWAVSSLKKLHHG